MSRVLSYGLTVFREVETGSWLIDSQPLQPSRPNMMVLEVLIRRRPCDDILVTPDPQLYLQQEYLRLKLFIIHVKYLRKLNYFLLEDNITPYSGVIKIVDQRPYK